MSRRNTDTTIFTLTAASADANGGDQTNYVGTGIQLVIDVTAVTSSPSLVVTLQGKDVASGKYYTLLASAAITGTGTTRLKVFPAATAAANAAANDILPKTWRVIYTLSGGTVTGTVGASVIQN